MDILIAIVVVCVLLAPIAALSLWLISAVFCLLCEMAGGTDPSPR